MNKSKIRILFNTPYITYNINNIYYWRVPAFSKNQSINIDKLINMFHIEFIKI